MKRGDVVVVAFQGDLGKPRLAVVVESDRLAPTEFVIVCLGTSHIVQGAEPRRLLVAPSAANGLREPTQFQADKLMTARREKCGKVIGRMEDAAMLQLGGLLAAILGLAD